MLRVYTCLVTEHDLRLVALAAIVCVVASYSAISLLAHARHAQKAMRPIWLAIASTSTGFGIWATHFIAMLAFAPGVASAYNVVLTIISLIAAIALTFIGVSVATAASFRYRRWAGGAIIGGGIAAMHYTGMAAFELAGTIIWDTPLVASSILLGALIGAAALPAGMRNGGRRLTSRLAGALLLTLAIVSHHFTAMAAVSIIPDPMIVIPGTAIPYTWLALAVALGSFLIILLALAAVAVDMCDRRHAEREADRIRSLANAAIEGLMVCHDTTIATVNNSLARLAGANASEMIGTSLERWLPKAKALERLFAEPDTAIETDLRRRKGETIPVEIILRPIDFRGSPHQAIAVRDLRARREAEQRIRFLAHHDPLTGLPNRAAFSTQLDHQIEHARTRGGQLAVLFLDPDRFKEVNDLYGHAAGDSLLRSVASRISELLTGDQCIAAGWAATNSPFSPPSLPTRHTPATSPIASRKHSHPAPIPGRSQRKPVSASPSIRSTRQIARLC